MKRHRKKQPDIQNTTVNMLMKIMIQKVHRIRTYMLTKLKILKMRALLYTMIQTGNFL